jgi:16S rRNA (guanine527-N7)-methyltransferase
MTVAENAVVAALEDARRHGFLGPGPVGEQVAHAVAFAELLEHAGVGPADFLDLGSGGGVPGLILAARWVGNAATLLDGSERRMAFLRRTIAGLGWESRVSVAEGRAESLARTRELRAAFSLVVSRSFATPAVTAEIGGAFLQPGGVLAVSEPAVREDQVLVRRRWPSDSLAELGLGPAELSQGAGAGVAILRRLDAVAERWPRGVGTPTKRPLW